MNDRNTSFRIKPSTLMVMGALTALFPGTSTYAQQAEPNTVGANKKTAIPRQPLTDALLTFSRVTGLQISADAGLLADKMSNTAAANLSDDAMLRAMLAGTGLSFQMMNA